MIEVFKIKEPTPYDIGFTHGVKLKKSINAIYKIILPYLKTLEKQEARDFYEEGLAMLRRMDPCIMDELNGLVKGSGRSLQDVVLINTFLTLYPAAGACNVTCYDARYDPSCLTVENSTECTARSMTMFETLDKTHNIMQTMESVKQPDSIQIMAYDHLLKILYLNLKGSPCIYKYTQAQIFGADTSPPTQVSIDTLHLSQGSVWTGRTLDWRMSPQLLATHTILLVRGEVATVTFPGYIGAITGFNSKGSFLSLLQQGSTHFPTGEENTLTFYKFLSLASKTEILDALQTMRWGGTCNVALSSQEGAIALHVTSEKLDILSQKSIKLTRFKNCFSEEVVNKIFGAIYELSPLRDPSDLQWGEHHFDDDPHLLEQACRQVLLTQERPYCSGKGSLFYIIPSQKCAEQISRSITELINAEHPDYVALLASIKENNTHILYHLWRLAGFPSGDPLWAEHHLESHLHLIADALIAAVNHKYKSLHRKLDLVYKTGLSEDVINQFSCIASIRAAPPPSWRCRKPASWEALRLADLNQLVSILQKTDPETYTTLTHLVYNPLFGTIEKEEGDSLDTVPFLPFTLETLHRGILAPFHGLHTISLDKICSL